MSGRGRLVARGRRLTREPIEGVPAASSRAAGYRAPMPVRYEVAAGGVATVTLDEPETRNALSDEVLDGLLEAFTAARDDPEVRVVVLTSSHDKVFSSGGNLAGFAAEQPLAHKH